MTLHDQSLDGMIRVGVRIHLFSVLHVYADVEQAL